MKYIIDMHGREVSVCDCVADACLTADVPPGKALDGLMNFLAYCAVVHHWSEYDRGLVHIECVDCQAKRERLIAAVRATYEMVLQFADRMEVREDTSSDEVHDALKRAWHLRIGRARDNASSLASMTTTIMGQL